KVAHAKYLEFPVGTGQRHYSYRQYCSLFEHYVDVLQLSAQLNCRFVVVGTGNPRSWYRVSG
ncbi:hypothetical protein ACL1IQ_14545, partial [Corynebacterium striatum]